MEIIKTINSKKYKVASNGPYFSIKQEGFFGWNDISCEFFSNLWDTEKEAWDWLEKANL